MPIARRNPKELKPYANNPKTHPPEQIAKIVALIDRYGFPDGKAIIIDENDEIIHGHGRCLAAIEMGLETVPVETIANLSEADKRAWRIADNAVAESEWDWGKLEVETCELQQLGFDLQLTGLDEATLGELQGLPDKSAEFRHFNDDPPDPTKDIEPRCKPGEIWALGKHRLLCGDSLDKDAIARLLNGQTPNFIWSDPPYGIAIQNKDGEVGGGGKKYPRIAGDKTIDCAEKALELYLSLFPKAIQIWWGANHYRTPPSPCWLVWDKKPEGKFEGLDFADAELAYANQDSAVRVFHHLWMGAVRASEVNEVRVHPTQKPVALAMWAFEKYGNSGDIIFDPFLGSGVSIVAAEELSDRIVLGCELLPYYCEVVMQRWERVSGKVAHLINDQTTRLDDDPKRIC
ncbi:MAG: site-specific DNA-methyltransferase [Cyanobacteria bacterium SBLK]|nr:site-specific DNA-methyltransferase [Cyanobacteria bacterium SBLK]